MKVLAAGDSHTKFFGITPAVRVVYPAVRDIRAEVHPINGATVAGVGRMNSTLQFRDQLSGWLAAADANVCVLNLGQVDVELGSPYRKYVKNESREPSDYLREIVVAYETVITGLISDFPHTKFVVKGANLPVLIYDTRKTIADIANVVTERISDVEVDRRTQIITRIRAEFESDVERNVLTKDFNKMLESVANDSGAAYFDVNLDVSAENGLVHPRFIPNIMDHHFVDSVEIRAIHWRNLLNAVGLDAAVL